LIIHQPQQPAIIMAPLSYSSLALALFLTGSAQGFVSPGRQLMSTSLNAVSKKDSYSVTLLPGDGIGPEITEATKVALASLCKKCGFEIELKEALIGGAAIDAKNDPFPQESLDQCLASDSVLLACIGGYKWDTNPRELRPESGLLKMRKEMGLFANLRPAKVLPQLLDASTLKREIVEGVDIMVVRELTGDVYFGTPKGIDVVNGRSSLCSIGELFCCCRGRCGIDYFLKSIIDPTIVMCFLY
jgi:isocitrate dehydrogenase